MLVRQHGYFGAGYASFKIPPFEVQTMSCSFYSFIALFCPFLYLQLFSFLQDSSEISKREQNYSSAVCFDACKDPPTPNTLLLFDVENMSYSVQSLSYMTEKLDQAAEERSF